MTSQAFVLLSGALTFGAPLVIAVHELLTLRRPPSRGPDGPGRAAPQPQPKPKPLPDCLIPKPRTRMRELEDA